LNTFGFLIPADQIEQLFNKLAHAKIEWTSKVGKPVMTDVVREGLKYSVVSAGEENRLIYDVTSELGTCIDWLSKMQDQRRIIREKGLALGVADPPAVAEVRQLISNRHDAASTWSLCTAQPFMQRVHDSFNSIGQMFIFTFCGGASKERQPEFQIFLTRLFDCQERFYVWYDGDKNKSYDPAVAAFLALRAILESSVVMLAGLQDRQQTVRMLQEDIDEIVVAMQAQTAAQPQTTTGEGDTDTQQALREMQTIITGL
jgi:hypothetical protein